MQSKYTKMSYQKIPYISRNVLELFVCPCTQSFCPIFMKSLKICKKIDLKLKIKVYSYVRADTATFNPCFNTLPTKINHSK